MDAYLIPRTIQVAFEDDYMTFSPQTFNEKIQKTHDLLTQNNHEVLSAVYQELEQLKKVTFRS